MAKKLIITEKPSVAFDFARVLKVPNSGTRRDGFIENNDYVISWCYGHLVQMVYPESYDIKYKSWKLEDLPFLPETYRYGVVESAKDQYAVVNKLLHREDIDTVYWAGDSGKEGQTIEENIRLYGGVRDGMTELRVWIDSQTDDEIMRGISEAKPMSDYALLGKSGIMRTIEDYALGINFSRALSVKYGRMINDAAATSSYTAIAIGRVMTCVLGMVVNREREIRNFNQDPFFKIVGHFSDIKFPAEWKALENTKYYNSPLLYGENNNGFKTKDDALKFIDELAGKEAVISNKEISSSKKKAPLLFNLAELQSECSKRFKISPAQTLDIIQDLYEKKYTTYPRTDARVLTTAVAKEITKNLNRLQGYEPTAKFVKEILAEKKYIGLEKSSYTDDSKVTDHYAIIPTGQCNGIDKLPSLTRAVYDLIVRRFLSIFYPPAEYKNVKITVKVSDESFFASAKVLTKPGFLEVAGLPKSKEKDTNDEDDDENEESFSKEDFIKFVEAASIGDGISVGDYKIKEGKTSPPKRYTSGNLILAMENAGKLIEEEELREQIKTTGIGTSATRGEILEKLVRIGYLNQNNKTQIISPEKLGEMIYEVVLLTTPSLLSPKMTANWEKGLEGIIDGSVDDVEYRKKLEDYIRKETNKMIEFDLTGQIAANINQFTGKDSKGLATRKPLGIKCPVCGGELVTTSFGYGCSNYRDEKINCRFSVGTIAGVDLSEEDFKKLITDGSTDVISGFKSKNKSQFSAKLKLVDSENGKKELTFDFDGVEPEKLEGFSCPDCGGRLLVKAKGISCENYNSADPNSCKFYLGKIIAGKNLSNENIEQLLKEGKTETIRGFKGKSGKKFDACLCLKKNEANKTEVVFDFDSVEQKILPDCVCPDCGGPILVKQSGYGCGNFSPDKADSCRFFIGKIAGKMLSTSNVQELLTEGKTKTIRDLKSKSGKKFDACLILKKNEEGKSEIAFDFDNVEAKVIEGVTCPICGGNIVKTSFGYGCSNYNRDDKENSCSFNIGQIAGVNLKEGQVKELLGKGITDTVTGFKSKKGSKFDAKLTFGRDEEGKITGIKFVFENNDQELKDLKCPICGESIIKGYNGYRCKNNEMNNPDSCSFFVGKIAGVEISQEQFEKLIKEKKTDVISGFLSRKGLFFDARLKLNEENKIEFDFEQFQ